MASYTAYLLDDGRRVTREELGPDDNFVGFGFVEETDGELMRRNDDWKRKREASYWTLLQSQYEAS